MQDSHYFEVEGQRKTGNANGLGSGRWSDCIEVNDDNNGCF